MFDPSFREHYLSGDYSGQIELFSDGIEEFLIQRLGASKVTEKFYENAAVICRSLGAEDSQELEREKISGTIIVDANRRKVDGIEIFSDKLLVKFLRDGGLPEGYVERLRKHLNIACGEMLMASGLFTTKRLMKHSASSLKNFLKHASSMQTHLDTILSYVVGLEIATVLTGLESQRSKLSNHAASIRLISNLLESVSTLGADIEELRDITSFYGKGTPGRKDNVPLKVFVSKFTTMLDELYLGERKLKRGINSADVVWIRDILKEFGLEFEDKRIDSAIQSLNNKTPTL